MNDRNDENRLYNRICIDHTHFFDAAEYKSKL